MDIGGTASRALVRSDGEVLAEATGPGANVATLDPEVVEERLSALLGELGDLRPVACCAGAAGAEVPEARERLRSLLQRKLDGCRLTVVHDARLVLAAAGLETGVALIAGTGSVAYGRSSDGREAQRGGWGWMLGDEGSAVWIAREAARAVMARFEAGQPIGDLGEALLSACGARDARDMVLKLHAMGEPMAWAAVASAVFATARDAGAMRIIERAAGALARLANEVEKSLGTGGPAVLAGGLLLHQPLLESAVREYVTCECVRLERPPVEGAVRLAEGLLVR
jgi:glucosamine kinase